MLKINIRVLMNSRVLLEKLLVSGATVAEFSLKMIARLSFSDLVGYKPIQKFVLRLVLM